MGLFSTPPPNLPLPPNVVDAGYLNQLTNVLRLYFTAINAVQPISVSQLRVDTATLPTEADLATLRIGDVYRDSTADNALKVKV